LKRLKDFKGVVKCFGTEPLCQFFNTLKFVVKVELAQLELKEHERKVVSERRHRRLISVKRLLGMQSCVRLFASRGFSFLVLALSDEGLWF
jgi:hypothetical protein